MRLYETAVVIDSQLKNDEIEDMINKFINFITNHGGEIDGVDEWGKRRLAYEINKRQYGFYVFIRFNAPGQIIKLLEREYRLSESVLRFLTIAVDKRALKLENMQRRQAEYEKTKHEAQKAQEDAKSSEDHSDGPEKNDDAPDDQEKNEDHKD